MHLNPIKIAKDRIQDQKIVANKVLYQIRKVDIDGAILGGAPRDWYIGNPAKDIDIFINDAKLSRNTLRGFLKVLLKCKPKYIDKKLYGPNDKLNPDIRWIIEFEYLNETFQIINIKGDIKEYYKTFPLNVSMCRYDELNDSIIGTPEFYHGHQMKEVIILNEVYCDNDEYVDRIASKLSRNGYKLIGDYGGIC